MYIFSLFFYTFFSYFHGWNLIAVAQIIQKAVQEMGGLEVLVNLLETNDIKCQNGSLSVLLQIATSTEMKRYLIDLDITTPLIQMLKHPARDVQVIQRFSQLFQILSIKASIEAYFRIRLAYQPTSYKY